MSYENIMRILKRLIGWKILCEIEFVIEIFEHNDVMDGENDLFSYLILGVDGFVFY